MQNLALSDLLFVTICIPPTAVDYAIGWPFGLGVCRVVQYLIHVSTYREARRDSEIKKLSVGFVLILVMPSLGFEKYVQLLEKLIFKRYWGVV